jgi:hypothetical protein
MPKKHKRMSEAGGAKKQKNIVMIKSQSKQYNKNNILR